MPKVKVEIDLIEIANKFDINDAKGKLALTLLDRAIFMQKELIRLEEIISKEGSVTEMCQGKYSIDRISPATNAYNGIIKNFTSVIKQVNDLLPSEENGIDAFEEFDNEE